MYTEIVVAIVLGCLAFLLSLLFSAHRNDTFVPANIANAAVKKPNALVPSSIAAPVTAQPINISALSTSSKSPFHNTSMNGDKNVLSSVKTVSNVVLTAKKVDNSAAAPKKIDNANATVNNNHQQRSLSSESKKHQSSALILDSSQDSAFYALPHASDDDLLLLSRLQQQSAKNKGSRKLIQHVSNVAPVVSATKPFEASSSVKSNTASPMNQGQVEAIVSKPSSQAPLVTDTVKIPNVGESNNKKNTATQSNSGNSKNVIKAPKSDSSDNSKNNIPEAKFGVVEKTDQNQTQWTPLPSKASVVLEDYAAISSFNSSPASFHQESSEWMQVSKKGEESVDQLKIKVSSLSQQLSNLNDNYDNLNKSFDEIKARKLVLERESKDIHKSYSEKLIKIENEALILRNQNAALAKDLLIGREASSEAQTLRDRLISASKEIADAQLVVDRFSKENADLKIIASENNHKMVVISKEHDCLQRNFSDIQAELSELHKVNCSMQKEMIDERKNRVEVARLHDLLKQSQLEKDMWVSKQSNLENELRQARFSIGEAASQHTSLAAEQSQISAKLQKEKIDLLAKVNLLESRVTELTSTLAVTEAKVQQHQNLSGRVSPSKSVSPKKNVITSEKTTIGISAGFDDASAAMIADIQEANLEASKFIANLAENCAAKDMQIADLKKLMLSKMPQRLNSSDSSTSIASSIVANSNNNSAVSLANALNMKKSLVNVTKSTNVSPSKFSDAIINTK